MKDKSIGTYIAVLLLGGYGLYEGFECLYVKFVFDSWRPLFCAIATLAFTGSVALFLERNWSKYFVYLVSAFVLVQLLSSVSAKVENRLPGMGLIDFSTLIAAETGIFLVTVGICIFVHRHFSGKPG
jgi:hypothetical protein